MNVTQSSEGQYRGLRGAIAEDSNATQAIIESSVATLDPNIELRECCRVLGDIKMSLSEDGNGGAKEALLSRARVLAMRVLRNAQQKEKEASFAWLILEAQNNLKKVQETIVREKKRELQKRLEGWSMATDAYGTACSKVGLDTNSDESEEEREEAAGMAPQLSPRLERREIGEG